MRAPGLAALWALAACAPDDVSVLEIPEGAARSYLWVLREDSRPSFFAGEASDLPTQLPRRSTTVPLQVAGYAEPLADLGLQRGEVRSSSRAGARFLPAPALILEGEYRDQEVRALAAVPEPWPEIARFRSILKLADCATVAASALDLEVGSVVQGAMTGMGMERIILAYGPQDYFVGTEDAGLERLRGPFGATAVRGIGQDEVLLAGLGGEIVEAEIGDGRLTITATLATTGPVARRIVRRGTATFVLAEDRTLRHHNAGVWRVLHDFGPPSPGEDRFLGGLSAEGDEAVVAVMGTTMVVITESEVSRFEVGPVSEVAAANVQVARVAGGPGRTGLFLRTAELPQLAELDEAVTQMAPSVRSFWFAGVSGRVFYVPQGRPAPCAVDAVDAPAVHLARRGTGQFAAATAPDAGRVRVWFLDEL